MVNQFGGDWTKAKLEILKRYLNAYTTALKKQNFHLCYVDAFAGTGYVDVGNSGEAWDNESTGLLKGSARLALEVDAKPFDSFLFIGQNRKYAAELSNLKQEFVNRDISVVSDDANTFLRGWCSSQNHRLGTPWRGQRAVAFLDPYATEVDWQTVEQIARTQSIDLWILFPLSALTRMLPTDKEPDPGNAARLNRVFGGPEWREELYQPSIQQPLFGDETLVIRREQQAIVEIYLSKLRSVFPAVADKPRWFLNSLNSPLFAFMFSAANPGQGGKNAVGIANHLLSRW